MKVNWSNSGVQGVLVAALFLFALPDVLATTIVASHDTWVREDNPTSNRNGNDQINARTDIDGDDNDVILLRFPTSSLTLPTSGASLNLYWQRTDGSTSNTLSLYGLNESHGAETTWDETTVVYDDAPGLIPDGLDPTAETGLGNTFDDVRDLDNGNLTLLVDNQDYGPQVQDTVYSFSGAALDAFINGDTNNEVTFLIVRGNESGSGNQARFWPKEQNNGLTAPYLDVVPEPASVALLGIGALAAVCRRQR